MTNWRALAIAAAAAGALAVLGARPVHATLEMQKGAKEAGFAEATNCMYCHGEKLPKKGAATFNERGKFLVDARPYNQVRGLPFRSEELVDVIMSEIEPGQPDMATLSERSLT